MTVNFGRALRTRIGIQTVDIATYAAGDLYKVKTYKRGDPASPDLSDDPVLGDDTLDNNRDATAPLVGMAKGDVQRTVPMALDEIGLWLCAAFGFPVTTGAEGAYTHTFKSGGSALQWLTVEDKITAAIFRMHRGVIVDGVTLSAVKENAYPQVVLDLLMRDCAPAVAALANDDGDPFSFQRPTAWSAIALWNGAAIGEATTANVAYKNNCDRWLALSGDEFPVSIDPMNSSGSGAMKLRMVSDTYHTLAKNGGPTGKLSLVWKMPGALAATRSLQWDFNACRLSDSGQPVEAAGEITSDFNIRPEQGTTGTPMVTVILKNNVASYVPPVEE